MLGKVRSCQSIDRNYRAFWVEMGVWGTPLSIQRAREVLSSAQLTVLSDKVLGIQTVFLGSSHCFQQTSPKNAPVRLSEVI
jgi:hypothetical protein